MVSYLLSGRGPASYYPAIMEFSVHRGQITAAQPGSHLSPILGMAPFRVGRMWTDVQKHTARDKI